MNKISKVCVGLLTIIVVMVIFSVLSGCGKEKAQPAANAETNVTATSEAQKAEEVKIAQLREQAKKDNAEANAKVAELKAKEAEMKAKEAAMKEAERKSAAEAAKTAADQKAAEQKNTGSAAKITLKTSNETINQVLAEIGYWETAADDFRGMVVTDCNLIDLDGKPHKLSSYRGKNVILFEWVTWAPAAKPQFDFLKELREKVSEDQLAILAVALQTDKDDLLKIKDYAQKEKLNFPVFYEPQNSLSTALQLNMFVPCSYFIRPDGTLEVGVMEIITIRDLIRVLQAK